MSSAAAETVRTDYRAQLDPNDILPLIRTGERRRAAIFEKWPVLQLLWSVSIGLLIVVGQRLTKK